MPTTYRVSVPDNPNHTTGLSLDEAVKFATLAGYDAPTLRSRLLNKGRAKLVDDVGSIMIEKEKPDA